MSGGSSNQVVGTCNGKTVLAIARNARPEPSIDSAVLRVKTDLHETMNTLQLEELSRAETYREDARTLHRLAAQTRFDFCRQRQLIALAEAFERLADRLTGSPVKQAAD